ncbi:MAG TPA: hypothetical protein VLG14_03090 [Sphingomonas sp.]|nr:hypothetical protein [Sphingomonas sp.]
MRFAQSVGEPYSPQQRNELTESRSALDAIRPNGRVDLERAMSVDLGLVGEAADGKASRAIEAMKPESRLRADPQLRADTFVQRWQALDRHRRLLLRDHETTRAGRVADTMVGMAKSLERDPQVEWILRNRRAAFGLPEMPGRSVDHSLSELAGRWRTRA